MSTPIEIRVGGLKQLFNSIDPSPFREKDLDPAAEEFIVEWAREAPRNAEADSVHEFFRARAKATRTKLRLLFRNGRISLVIGIVCMALSITAGSRVEDWLDNSHFAGLLSESILIGGWVAMWKPLEIFLYELVAGPG